MTVYHYSIGGHCSQNYSPVSNIKFGVSSSYRTVMTTMTSLEIKIVPIRQIIMLCCVYQGDDSQNFCLLEAGENHSGIFGQFCSS